MPTCSTPMMAAVTLKRSSPRGRWRLAGRTQCKNSLLAGVGYLELANTVDFAANVWNQIPVPRHAVILMAIGGPFAVLMTLFAICDFYLSWQNVSLLQSERRALRSHPCLSQITSNILAVNTRELGTELIDRMLMDFLFGIGALLVGTGTIMAIWGANPHVFKASNLLSGYIGNGLPAAFGVVNAMWSAYLAYRFQIRWAACTSDASVQRFRPKLRQRFKRLQFHAGINGANGLVAGMASMVTSKMWWGYVVLVPCVIVAIAVNIFWRTRLGYDRPVAWDLLDDVHNQEKTGTRDYQDRQDILDALENITTERNTLRQIVETAPLDILLDFLLQNQMFALFCERITRVWADHLIFDVSATKLEICITPEDFIRGSCDERTRMESECRRFLVSRGDRVLDHRERYLLELLGESVWMNPT